MAAWNRRTFLKTGALTAAGALFAGVRTARAGARKAWNAKNERSLRKYRAPKPTLCRVCHAHCALLAYRDGDRVVQIKGNPGSPTNRGGICPRAYAGLERVYDPERVLTPLKRTGPRGSGQWEPVTWEKALADVSARLADPKAKNVLHLGQEELLVEELRGTLGWSDVLVDELFSGRPGPGSGAFQYGAPVVRPDVLHAETILLFGASANGGWFALPMARDFMDARRRGAELHLIDSVSATAGTMAYWHPVYPGKEGVVALGMARLLFIWNKIDYKSVARAFCPAAENREDLLNDLERLIYDKPEVFANRAVLRKVIGNVPDNPVKARAMTALMPEGDEKQLMRELVNRPAGLLPLLSELSSVLDKLEEMLAFYTPETVKELSDFPAADVVTMARRFVDHRPSVAVAPPGSTAMNEVSLLNNLVGAVDVTGGEITARGPFFLPRLNPTRAPESWFDGLAKGAEHADLLFLADTNPAYQMPGSPALAQALCDPAKVGLLVAMDTHLTESALMADYFLPLATSYETWGLVEGSLANGRSYLYIQQPVTRAASESSKLKDPASDQLSWFEPWSRPLGEARGLSDTLLELARRKAPAAHAYTDTRDYMGKMLIRSWGPGSFESLRARGIWVSEEARTPPRRIVVDFTKYLTLPTEKPSGLRLMAYSPTTVPHHYANTRLGREIHHDCELLIHPLLAAATGLSDGDRVKIRTSTGSVQAPVRLRRSQHPGLVLLPDGYGRTAGGMAAQNIPEAGPAHTGGLKEFKTFPYGLPGWDTQEETPLWWEHSGPGVSLRSIFPLRLDGEGLADWSPVPVEIERA